MAILKTIWSYTLAWLALAAVAVLLALAAPREIRVMGQLPGDVGRALHHQPVVARAQETPLLALVTFHRDHRAEVETWIEGLRLHSDRSIVWVRMPVVDDNGDHEARAAVEQRLLARYAQAHEREHLLPVFTNREAFVQATGVRSADRAYVLVVNRRGEVLARVAGPFDETKAHAVRETLASSTSL